MQYSGLRTAMILNSDQFGPKQVVVGYLSRSDIANFNKKVKFNIIIMTSTLLFIDKSCKGGFTHKHKAFSKVIIAYFTRSAFHV